MPNTVAIAAAAAGANEVLPAAVGYKYRVLAFVLSFSGTVNAKFQSDTTDLTGLVYGVAGGVAASPTIPVPASQVTPPGQFVTGAGEALNLNLSGATAVGGYVVYEKIPASI